MNKKLKVLGKILIITFCTLVLAEISLRILGYFYAPQNFPKKEIHTITDKNSFRVMAIGDSWTEGAGAKPGQGYVEVFLELLRRKYPNIKIEGFNYARGSFNSSEACLKFLKYYKEVKPHLLIVLMGINNVWNTHDVSLSHQLLNKEIGFEGIDKYQISIWGKVLSWLNKLKLVRLSRIIYCNLVFKPDDMIGPHPMDDNYVGPFFERYIEHGDREKAKEDLIKHFNEASSYDDFYRLMLYLFDHRAKDVEVYLKERQLWRPELIKFKFNQKQQDFIVSLRYKILKEHLIYLKKVCDLHDIKMVVQNYPQYGNNYIIELNRNLFELAKKINVPFVNHYRLFTEILGIEGFKKTQSTCSHVNTDGHYQMAENLYKAIVKLNLL